MHRITSTIATAAENFLGRIRDRFGSGRDRVSLPFIDEVLEEAARLRPHWGDRPEQWVGVLVNKGPKTDDDGNVILTEDEYNELKRTVSEKDREVRDLKKEAKAHGSDLEELREELKELKDKGGDEGDGDKALLRRIDELEKRTEKAESKADAETEKREAAEKQTTAVDVATRLNFRNPKRAVKQLDSDDLDDEDSIEQALERLANEEPYMVSTKKQRTVEDKPKAKKADKKPDVDGDEKDKKGDDDLVGKARIKAAYDEADEGGEDGDGDGGESD